MTRWSSDPEAAARTLIASDIDAHAMAQPALWAGATPPDAALGTATWHRRHSAAGPGTPEPPRGPFATVLLRLPKSRAEQLMATHLCLGVLARDGRLIVYGGNDEGIRPFQKVLAGLGATTTRATRGHGRVLQLLRCDVTAPLKPTIADWRQERPTADRDTPWISYPGLFAGGAPDAGTQLLLTHLPPLPATATVLDYGAGPGAIAAHIRRVHPGAQLTLLDNDSVALLAARANIPDAAAIAGDRLEAAGPKRFDLIVSNPPLHTGFQDDTGPLLRLIAAAPAHLTSTGALLLVVQSRIALEPVLAATFATVERLVTDRRYAVWRASGRRPPKPAPLGRISKTQHA